MTFNVLIEEKIVGIENLRTKTQIAQSGTTKYVLINVESFSVVKKLQKIMFYEMLSSRKITNNNIFWITFYVCSLLIK